ncbi:YkyB family protein [Metabacillus arenae]|uniref:YkyB-like protein n=1 Tax=Metabacillus arenae TaxID=2771434 RepID=A0A926NIQ1_9BACI|nr:YkyB family protein [Metabacillus arenae]MBD1381268.1 hypothetical protein [Metabacillus arenae]
MDERKQSVQIELTVDNIAKAIFIVNRHAKTAPNPKFLYLLKRKALLKLIKEGKAKKKGLHYSNNPKYSQQQSDVLISAGSYYFHMPPTKEDFENLPHLGTQNNSYRNPKTHLSLTRAKSLLQNYVGIKEKSEKSPYQQKACSKPVFKKLGESYF